MINFTKNQLIIIFVVLGIFALVAGNYLEARTDRQVAVASPIPKAVVKINDLKIPVEIADDQTERDLGLSAHNELPADEGMLFTFGGAKTPTAFWMKDMQFSVDMIWIADGKVVQIHKNAMPEPGISEANLKTYIPNEPVHFVLEVNAGFADKNNIAPGDIFTPPNEAN